MLVPAEAVHAVGHDDTRIIARHALEPVVHLAVQLAADLVEAGDVAVVDEADRNASSFAFEAREVPVADLGGRVTRHLGRVDDVLPRRDDAEAVAFEADHLDLGVGRDRTGTALGGAVGRRVQQAGRAVELAVDLGGALERRFDERLLLQPEPALVESAVALVRVAARQTLGVRGVGVRLAGGLLGRLAAGVLLVG